MAGRPDGIDLGPLDNIQQLGRSHPANAKFGYYHNDLDIIPAREPLQHHSLSAGQMGFPLIFATHYLRTGLLTAGREVLLLPCASGGVGFSTNPGWSPDGGLYDDLVKRCAHVMDSYPGSTVKAVLWHQGEADSYGSDAGHRYQRQLDTLITDIRRNIGIGDAELPFILGQFVQGGVLKTHATAATIDAVICDTPNRLPGTAVVRNVGLTSNDDMLNDGDTNHFSAAAQIDMATRYFDSYLHLLSASLQAKISNPSHFITSAST